LFFFLYLFFSGDGDYISFVILVGDTELFVVEGEETDEEGLEGGEGGLFVDAYSSYFIRRRKIEF